MALTNIHEFVDDEIITHDDLNSIGEAVSSELTGGGIGAGSLVWPLVCQGDIDMNGYSITGISAFFEVYHVNASQTLAVAVAAVNSANGGTIVIDDFSAATASDLLVTANNVTIMGTSGKSLITMGASSSNYGIGIQGSNFRLIGVQVTGGKTGIPAINVHSSLGAEFKGNTFSAHTGPCITFTGSSNLTYGARVTNNSFSYCEEEGIIASNLLTSTIANNTFANMGSHNIELGGDTDYLCQDLTISGNTMRASSGDGIFAEKTGTAVTAFGQITISGNAIDTGAGQNAINIGSYLNCTIVGNTLQDEAVINIVRGTVTGNTFNSVTALGSTVGIFTGNNFRGAATISGGSANIYTGNVFEQAVEIDATEVSMFTSNLCIGGCTTTATVPDIVGLNWGY